LSFATVGRFAISALNRRSQWQRRFQRQVKANLSPSLGSQTAGLQRWTPVQDESSMYIRSLEQRNGRIPATSGRPSGMAHGTVGQSDGWHESK
jgi:hypothetical protein